MSARIKIECIDAGPDRPKAVVSVVVDGRTQAGMRYFLTWAEAVEWAFRLTAPVMVPESTKRTPPPCGARACTGCVACLTAWAAADVSTLHAWQVRLVERYMPQSATWLAEPIPPILPSARVRAMCEPPESIHGK